METPAAPPEGSAAQDAELDPAEPLPPGAATDDSTKRQRRSKAPAAGVPPGDMQTGGGIPGVDDAAAGALVEAVAGSVLEALSEDAGQSIVRLRGLPWSYGGKEVCEFLAGVSVNLQPENVTMLHNAAGEAFVALSTPAQLSEVLQHNHQQIGRRYVEIFASTATEKQAACERNRATMREDASYRGVLRMRGLPFTATVDDLLGFFGNPTTLQAPNVHLMRKADGRSSGDAYAVFDTEEAAVDALQFDKQKLGSRWVDLFQSNKGELYSLTSLGGIMLGGPIDGAANGTAHKAESALGEGYSVVKLRGLPWNVTTDDIHTFLVNINVPQGGIHLMNGPNGRPSGLAYVELSSEEDQAEALRRDKNSIGGRYIDVFACSQTELQARLAGGLERGGLPGGYGAPNSADAHFVKLRGLPYQATENQIAGFFQPLQVVAVQIAFNSNAQPSGFGFVQFRTPDDVASALSRSNQVLGSRYVEVFRCTRAEMEQARVHALSVTPFARGNGGMNPNHGQGGRGQGVNANGAMGGHRAASESAFAAYQAALQTLATRQHAGYATGAAVASYPATATYTDGSTYAAANGTMGVQSAAAGFGGSYGNADVYASAAGGYGQSAGYGQVSGGYASGGQASGYGPAPATAGYTSTGASASQASYYQPQAAGANGAPQAYTAADYAQYSNYYYSPQGATYQ